MNEMNDTLTHFLGNLPSIIFIIGVNFIVFFVKTTFVDRKTLSSLEERIKEDWRLTETKLQSQIDKLKAEQYKQHTDFIEVKSDVKHILKAIDELKDLVKRKK